MSPLLLVLLVCVAFVANLSAQARTDQVLHDIAKIQEKLEGFALYSKESSGLAFNELLKVAQEYEAWPSQEKLKYRKLPGFHLVTDFAINPMKHIAFQLEEDPALYARHLKRVENGYKRFRPAYFGSQIGEKKIKIKVNRTTKLFRILSGQDKDIELTLKHFQDAKAESDIWHDRVEELTTVDDIFASLNELESIFNYFNAPVFKPLFDDIFPNLKSNSQVSELLKLYLDKMWDEQGVKFLNGQATRMRDVGGPKTISPGFVHVETA